MIIRRFSLVALLLAVALPTGSANAQSVLGMLTTDVKNSAGDAWDVWTSPFRGRPSDWLLAVGTLAAPDSRAM